MVAATIPVALYVTDVVPESTAIQQHWPTAAKIMSLRCKMRNSISWCSERLLTCTHSADPINEPDGYQGGQKVRNPVEAREQ